MNGNLWGKNTLSKNLFMFKVQISLGWVNLLPKSTHGYIRR
jgi:hypothetical protein